MVSAAENLFRVLGSINPDQGVLDRMAESFVTPERRAQLDAVRTEIDLNKSNLAIQQENLANARAQRSIQANEQAARQKYLGSLFSTGFNPSAGLQPQQIIDGLQAGVSPQTLGSLQQMLSPPEPTDLQQNLQTLGAISQMQPELQNMYLRMYGGGGTTVNVGGENDPFTGEFQKTLAKGFGQQVSDLSTESEDLTKQSASTIRALDILSSNPNIDISPTAPITNQVKSLFQGYLTEDQLKSVSDFQTLNSQLVQNRFDLTQILKGAITEKEQEAAQIGVGTTTGTKKGLSSTLINNAATAQLLADEKARRADYIRQQGANYSPAKFNTYYKELGEKGLRPTYDQIKNSLESQHLVPEQDNGQKEIIFLGFE